MRSTKLDHVQLHWRQDGDPDGFPVLFIHSLGTDLRVWDDVIPRLPKGLRLLRYDLRGHGLSSCPPAPYTIDNLADDAEQLLDQLGIASCAVVGVSIGGQVGLKLAAKRHGLVRSLVFSNSAVRLGDPAMWRNRIAQIEQVGLDGIADVILQRWFNAEFRQRTNTSAWRAMVSRTPMEGYIGCCKALSAADLTQSAKELALPVLAIAGSVDEACPPDLVKATADLLPGAQYHLLEGIAHLPSIEAPETLASAITDFIME